MRHINSVPVINSPELKYYFSKGSPLRLVVFKWAMCNSEFLP